MQSTNTHNLTRAFLLHYINRYIHYNSNGSVSGQQNITKTRIFKYIENFAPKTEIFQIKKNDIFHISSQNIDCGFSLEPPRRGGSNEYPQSMFLRRTKDNNVYFRKPQFYYIKWGLRGSALYGHVFMMSPGNTACICRVLSVYAMRTIFIDVIYNHFLINVHV